MAEFIKRGDSIKVKPQGLDYDLISGKVYDLNWDRMYDTYILTENGELNLPKKIYELKKDVTFKKRVLNYFSNSSTQTTGIMLAGTKGTGKTLLAKVLAKDSELPIIVVNSNYPSSRLNAFFKEFQTPVCILFDEVEKNWDTNRMLEFLDGVQATAKKLVIMTCNNLNKVSEYMQDRCSRVRYLRKYTEYDNIELIASIVKDYNVKNPEKVADFIIRNIRLLSIDNVISFLNEVLLLQDDEDYTLETILEDMNISSRIVKDTVSIENIIIKELAKINNKTEKEIKSTLQSNLNYENNNSNNECNDDEENNAEQCCDSDDDDDIF